MPTGRPTADAAATALAAAIQETVRKATAPRSDGKLGYTFHGCMIGVLPPDAKKPGAAVKFTAAQTMAGEMTYDKVQGMWADAGENIDFYLKACNTVSKCGANKEMK